MGVRKGQSGGGAVRALKYAVGHAGWARPSSGSGLEAIQEDMGVDRTEGGEEEAFYDW